MSLIDDDGIDAPFERLMDLEEGVCPVCHRSKPLGKRGRLRKHLAQFAPCQGAGMLPRSP
jgi:hypothetical protein